MEKIRIRDRHPAKLVNLLFTETNFAQLYVVAGDAMALVATDEERPSKLENAVVLGRPVRYTGSGRRTA
jgi:hypothetical protein